MTQDFIRNRILEAISRPLSEHGGRALESFLDLPHVDSWNPNNMYLHQLSTVFDIGLPFSFLRENLTARAHMQKVGAAISRGESVPSSLLSEVHAGALLRNWGAAVSFVPRQDTPTPDIEAIWSDGTRVDVEVTRGETRQLHVAVRNGINAFAGALQPSDVAWNITGFMADASNCKDLAAMFEAATALQPEQSAEDPGKWYVRAVPLGLRDSVVGAHAIKLFGPTWWPDNEPSYVSTSTLIGATENQVVQIRSLIPLASYMNPLLRKASSGQGRPGIAYLIALDVSDLPRAHERIVDDLRGYFEIWSHVSAVLLFEPRFYIGFEKKEWLVSIHRNPSATISLPEHLASVGGEQRSIEFSPTQ